MDVRETLSALSSQAGAPAGADAPAVVRTPEERFEALAGFDFAPHYRQVGELRLAHLDEGDGPPVVLLHGSPTWSYLWRRTIPPLCAAGYRCVAPDQVGYGRSDKPTDLRWYRYARYVDTGTDLLERLDLRDVTLVVHDWGTPVGLRLAAEHPDRIERIVAMNGTLPLGHPPSEAWQALRAFIEQTPDLPIAGLIQAGCHEAPAAEVLAAYEAPFPGPEFKAGPRSGPLLRPTSPTTPTPSAAARCATRFAPTAGPSCCCGAPRTR